MEWLLNSVKQWFIDHGVDRTYWIAFSGGLDSRVLLQLCVAARAKWPALRLRAVHVNHGLSAHAAQWLTWCSAVCREVKIDFEPLVVNAMPAVGESPEEAARRSRYAAFAEQLAAGDMLLTAHQQDDQAETLLLQLLRGAGPKGLAAMPTLKPFAKGWHARPLLAFTRDDLKQYALAHDLRWIEDESNTNTQLTRNFLRHEVMPLLKTRWPTVAKSLARSAENCAETVQVLEEMAGLEVSPYLGSRPSTLALAPVLQLTPARQRYLLRAWLSQLQIPLPSAVKLRQIQHDFLTAREDKAPHIQWGGVELRRYQGELYVMECLPSHDPRQVFQWEVKQPLVLPGIGELHAVFPAITEWQPEGEGEGAKGLSVCVRFRRGGESCQLPGRDYHHLLKKLFQTWNVPPWERDRIPLIYWENELIAVVGHYLNEAFFSHHKITFELKVRFPADSRRAASSFF